MTKLFLKVKKTQNIETLSIVQVLVMLQNAKRKYTAEEVSFERSQHRIYHASRGFDLAWLFNNYSSSPKKLRGHEGERNNFFRKIQLVGQKYRDKTTLASKS